MKKFVFRLIKHPLLKFMTLKSAKVLVRRCNHKLKPRHGEIRLITNSDLHHQSSKNIFQIIKNTIKKPHHKER